MDKKVCVRARDYSARRGNWCERHLSIFSAQFLAARTLYTVLTIKSNCQSFFSETLIPSSNSCCGEILHFYQLYFRFSAKLEMQKNSNLVMRDWSCLQQKLAGSRKAPRQLDKAVSDIPPRESGMTETTPFLGPMVFRHCDHKPTKTRAFSSNSHL